MNRLQKILFSISLLSIGLMSYGQGPDGIDPGNPRGSEGTVDFWQDPIIYIPVLLIIVLILVLTRLAAKRKKR